MNEMMRSSLVESLSVIPDPRVIGRTSHKLIDILVISVLAVISGRKDWEEIADYGLMKADWLKDFLSLENGIPSHDTFNRVFEIVESEAWEKAFIGWVAKVFDQGEGKIIAIDGKSIRGSKDRKLGKRAIHMVSAFASEQELLLGQLATEEKSNEITAIPELLNHLDVSDCLVTIDAMGCQTEIAQKIVDLGADYFLAVKKNQKRLYENVTWLFNYAASEADLPQAVETFEAEHGRFDTRRCWVLDYDGFLEDKAWQGLSKIVKVFRKSEDPLTGKVSKDSRYYITSADTFSPDMALRASRLHWGVENHLHWSLDVTFKEDASRARAGHAARNLSLLRRTALNLLKRVEVPKLSIKRKQFRALMDDSFALTVLNAI